MEKELIIDGVIVVEGSNDVSYISSFIDSLFFATNGYDLNDRKIEFLKAVSGRNSIYVLTDPDEAGLQIRNKLKTQVKGVIDIEIPKNSRKNYKKKGVAESSKEMIIAALKPYATTGRIKTVEYGLSSIISLSKNPMQVRNKIVEKYRLIDGNNKSLENQLNMLKVSKEEVEQIGKE